MKALLDQDKAPRILDVRNPDEVAICRLPGSTVIPFPELAQRLGEIDPAETLIVHCKSGGRSQKAVALLEQAGFRNARNLTGGILAWIRDVDPSLTPY